MKIPILKSTTILDGLSFPECPRWHNNKLYFSNIFADELIVSSENGKIEEIIKVPSIGIDFLSDGSIIYNEMNRNRQRIMKYKNGKISVYCDSLYKISPFMFNDMVISSKGYLYTGNTGCNAESDDDWKHAKPAPIAIITKNRQAKIVAENMICPNGMAITPDEKTLLVAEPFANRLTSFEIDENNGTLSDKRIFATFPSDFYPDGICIDEECGVWVAGGNGCARVDKEGQITHKIETVGTTSLACMLGGKDKTTLYICTKDILGFDPILFNKSKSGKIEVVHPKTAAGSGRP